MVNHRRGEISVEIAGARHRLRLTLNALAEIEAAFGAGGLAGLGERFAKGGLGSRDLVALLGAALRGGGGNLSDEALGALLEAGDLPRLAEALGRLFAANFGTGDAPGPRKAQR